MDERFNEDSCVVQVVATVLNAIRASVFKEGQEAVMHIIDGIMLASNDDEDAVAKLREFSDRFWGDDAE